MTQENDTTNDDDDYSFVDDPHITSQSLAEIADTSKHNGEYVYVLTPEHLAALQAGQNVVFGVNGHEYGLVIIWDAS